MISVKCVFKGKNDTTHELTMTIHDNVMKWSN